MMLLLLPFLTFSVLSVTIRESVVIQLSGPKTHNLCLWYNHYKLAYSTEDCSYCQRSRRRKWTIALPVFKGSLARYHHFRNRFRSFSPDLDLTQLLQTWLRVLERGAKHTSHRRLQHLSAFALPRTIDSVSKRRCTVPRRFSLFKCLLSYASFILFWIKLSDRARKGINREMNQTSVESSSQVVAFNLSAHFFHVKSSYVQCLLLDL